MAPAPVKHEYLAEYEQGWGSNFFLIAARSPAEVEARYPLIKVIEIDEEKGWTEQALDESRAFPGAGRPLDTAVAHRSEEERKAFVDFAEDFRAKASERRKAAGLDSGGLPESQLWVDIDDDEDFREYLHHLMCDDPRYQELPPGRKLG